MSHSTIIAICELADSRFMWKLLVIMFGVITYPMFDHPEELIRLCSGLLIGFFIRIFFEKYQ